MIKNNSFLTSLSKDLVREVRDLMAGKSSVEAPLEELGEAAKTLTAKQKKHIDKNKNGKIDADDFHRLRNEGIDRVVIHSPYTPDIHGGLAEVTHRDLRTGVVTVMFENMYYKLKKGQFKELPEEFEQLDELSKATLSSYIKKAASSAANKGMEHGVKKAEADEMDRVMNRHMSFGDKDKVRDIMKTTSRDVEKPREKAMRRLQGIDRATDRLTKEEVEELDEASSYSTAIKNAEASRQRAIKKAAAAYKRHGDMDRAIRDHDLFAKDAGKIKAMCEEVELTQEEIDNIEAILADLEEGRGRPPKEGSEAWKRRQAQAAEDVPALGIQLRKAASINKPVTFANGETKQIHPGHINRFNDHMDARKTSQEKADFQKTANKSHADFVKAVTADIPRRAKDTGEIVKYGK